MLQARLNYGCCPKILKCDFLWHQHPNHWYLDWNLESKLFGALDLFLPSTHLEMLFRHPKCLLSTQNRLTLILRLRSYIDYLLWRRQEDEDLVSIGRDVKLLTQISKWRSSQVQNESQHRKQKNIFKVFVHWMPQEIKNRCQPCWKGRRSNIWDWGSIGDDPQLCVERGQSAPKKVHYHLYRRRDCGLLSRKFSYCTVR